VFQANREYPSSRWEADSVTRFLTNADGAAVFAGLRQGEYAIHAASDGELPDDPKVDLHPKGCLDVYLFRALRINGLVTTRGGLPAARIEVQVRSAQDAPASGAMTGPDGRYELRIDRPGEYYLGVNLNHTATRDSPYARWFYPGTEDPAVAARIVFSGKPEVRTYDLSLPDPQPQRVIEGIILKADGQPIPRAVISVLDSSQTFIGQAIAGPDGRFALHVFGGVRYRLHAVWPGNQQEPAVSAPSLDIPAGTSPLSLQLTLTQPGNSALEERQPGTPSSGEQGHNFTHVRLAPNGTKGLQRTPHTRSCGNPESSQLPLTQSGRAMFNVLANIGA
jgi:hypothetical protein